MLIRWDNRNDTNLMFMHPYGSSIPPLSALIVRENQIAVFRVGGQYITYDKSGTIPASWDDRSEEEIIAEVYLNNMENKSEEEIIAESDNNEADAKYRTNAQNPPQLDTAVYFFSTRIQKMTVSASKVLTIGETGYDMYPQMTITYSIDSGEEILRQQIDDIEVELRAWCEQQIIETAERSITGFAQERFTDRVIGNGAARRIETRMNELSSDLFNKIKDDIAAQHIGISVRSAILDLQNRIAETGRITKCPECNKSYIISTDRLTRCQACGNTFIAH